MKLREDEKSLIDDAWRSDFDIEIYRKDYIVVLESKTWYSNNCTIRHYVSQRDIVVYDNKFGYATIVDIAEDAEQAIETLKKLSITEIRKEGGYTC
jgi:hypothetical protein